MGLTLHYTLESDVRTLAQARQLMLALRETALTMNMLYVGPVRAYPKPGLTPTGRRRVVPKEYRIGCTRFVQRGSRWLDVEPLAVAFFNVLPADGSESALFGLAKYPRTVRCEGRARRTGLVGWNWQNFCKTQYASNPKYGGVENFLHAHLSLVALLDRAVELGIRADVSDEGKYWEHRDRDRLAAEVGGWNRMIAAVGGKLKDAGAGEVEAEIFKFPNFEHLEAQGNE